MDNSEIRLDGVFLLTLNKANGESITICKHNLITTIGFDFICDCIGNPSNRPNVMGYIGLGAGSAAPAESQTTLTSEIRRLPATYSHTAGTKVFTMSAIFNAGVGTGAIAEAGIFNDSTGGVMLDRVSFAVINKGVDDTLTAQFTFTLS